MACDIELEISAGTAPGDFTIRVVRAPSGAEPTTTMHLDIDALLDSRARLETTVLASAVTGRRIGSAGEQQLRQMGQQLFEALFCGPVSGTYRASLGVAQQRSERLRVVLRLTAPQLAALPWEAMFDPEIGKYICRREPLVRRVPAPYTCEPLEAEPPLRLLGLVASPLGMPILDVDAEQNRLLRALAGPSAEGLIELNWLAEASWEAVQDALLSNQWHVLHFIGHGFYDPTIDQGLIALVGPGNRPNMVEAEQLADLLDQANPTPRLVVLNSCSSGEAGPQDLLSCTAAALVHSGINAVAAMQFTVSDSAAITFARGFYTALANGRGIDEATRSGRIAILGTPGTLEWVTPVLYLRGDTTQLFDFKPPQRDTPREQIVAAEPRPSAPQPGTLSTEARDRGPGDVHAQPRIPTASGGTSAEDASHPSVETTAAVTESTPNHTATGEPSAARSPLGFAELSSSSAPQPTEEAQSNKRGVAHKLAAAAQRRWIPITVVVMVVVAAAVGLGIWGLTGNGSKVTSRSTPPPPSLTAADVDLLKVMPEYGYGRANCTHQNPWMGADAVLACDKNPVIGAPAGLFFHFLAVDPLTEMYKTLTATYHTTNCPGDPPGIDGPRTLDRDPHKEVGRIACYADNTVTPAAPSAISTNYNPAVMQIFHWTYPGGLDALVYILAHGGETVQDPPGKDPDFFTQADLDLLNTVNTDDYGKVNCRHTDTPPNAKADLACINNLTTGAPHANLIALSDKETTLTYYDNFVKIYGTHRCGGSPSGSDDAWFLRGKRLGRYTCGAEADPTHNDVPVLMASASERASVVSIFFASTPDGPYGVPPGTPYQLPKNEQELTDWFTKRFTS